MGAVIGHEITHGFDSQGRLFDALGNLSNWWTPADEKSFLAQTGKLVRQANAYQILPGAFVNGQLTLGENLADAGGISLADSALSLYLREHPRASRKIDGLTPHQRMYLAWSQQWADKAREASLRQTLATDPHSPGLYRMLAPNQHSASFFRAFGIRAGDPMWLAEQERIRLW